MNAVLHRIPELLRAPTRRTDSVSETADDDLSWNALPRTARIYVALVLAAGVGVLAGSLPGDWPHPLLFAALLIVSCITSSWKVSLPISVASGSTLSVSYAADLTSLLLLGWRPAMVVAMAGAWTQCTVKVRRPYPWYRTAFSVAAEALTIAATGIAYSSLHGTVGPTSIETLAPPLVGAIAAYFLVNTALVACAIGLSLRQSIWKVWHDDFLWSAPSFMVAGAAGAVAAVIISRGQEWLAVLMLAPVYLIYRTYDVFLRRLEDEVRHGEETRRLHQEALDALRQARLAEQALAEEKERLAVTLRSIGDGVITTDLNGTILLMNSAAESLTGWTFEEAAGLSLDEVFQTVDSDTRKRLDNLVPTPASSLPHHGCTRPAILVGRDLTERPIEQSAVPLRDRRGRAIGVVIAFRDITDALRIQEERAKAGKLSSLGLLAGGIAHDFNNVLMAIMGNVSIARATMRYAGPALNALAEAEQACVRARQLTWQLLTFSKGGVPMKKTVGIARLLQESATTALRGSTVACSIDAPADLWPVHADEVQLIQVFSNVLINAQEAMPHGGTVSVTVQNVTESEGRWEHALPVQSGEYVRICISDTGIGIPTEHLARIFDPYFSTKQRGSGLGLATTYSIVKNHGGFLAVDSRLGHGTTVRINLPAAPNREQIDSVPAPVADEGGRRRILVMDDEASVRTLAVNMLEFLGYDAEVVENGTAAVERFAEALKDGRPFHAVMLDLIVPGEMGATDAIDQLSGLDPAVRAILVSGYAQDSVLSEYRDLGFQAIITKPFTLQELKSTLTSVMAMPAWRVH